MMGANMPLHSYCRMYDILPECLDIKMFKQNLRQVMKASSTYRLRDRKAIIRIKLRNLKDTLLFNGSFFDSTKRILDAYWSQINYTTDDVITGTVCALTLINNSLDFLTIQTFCKELGISHSAIIYQIKNKILDNENKHKFKTVTESKTLIINTLEQTL